jgi:hypothetical protein
MVSILRPGIADTMRPPEMYRAALIGFGELALLVGLLLVSASPGMAVSITPTYREIGSRSLTMGVATGIGDPSGASVGRGIPNIASIRHGSVIGHGQTGDPSKFLPVHWAGASSGFDRGRVEAVGGPVATAFALTGKHRLGQSGVTFTCDGCLDGASSTPKPAMLLLFGTALVGLGAAVRRGMRGVGKSTV